MNSLRPWLNLSFLLFFLLAPKSWAQPNCSELLKSKTDSHTWFSASPLFSESDFFAAKAEMKNLASIHSENLQTPEQKLAFFEILAEQKGHDFLSWTALQNRSAKKSKKFLSLIKQLSFDEPKSDFEIDHFLTELYMASNQWTPWWKKFIGPSSEEIIQQRIQIAKSKQDISDILVSLGILKKDTLLQRLRRQTQSWGRLTMITAGNVLSYHALGWPLFFNSTDFSTHQSTQKKLKWAASTDALTDKLRRLMAGLLIGAALNSGINWSHLDLSEVKNTAAMTYRISTGFIMEILGHGEINMEILKQTMDTDIYKAWSINYESSQGHPPDPLGNLLDRARWVDFVNNLPEN